MTAIPSAIAGVAGGLAVTTISELLGRLPEGQRDAAGSFLAEFAPTFFEMTAKQVWEYIRRMNEGDFQVIPEIMSRMSDEAFMAKVNANTTLWENVAASEVAKQEFQKQLVLKLIPIVGAILSTLVLG